MLVLRGGGAPRRSARKSPLCPDTTSERRRKEVRGKGRGDSERPAFTHFLANALVLSSPQSRSYSTGKHVKNCRRGRRVPSYPTHVRTAGLRSALRRGSWTARTTTRSHGRDEPTRRWREEDLTAEVFDMAQRAATLFRETSIRDSEALADIRVLLVIVTQLFEASRVQEAVANAEEAVGHSILQPPRKRKAEEYKIRACAHVGGGSPRLVRVVQVASNMQRPWRRINRGETWNAQCMSRFLRICLWTCFRG